MARTWRPKLVRANSHMMNSTTIAVTTMITTRCAEITASSMSRKPMLIVSAPSLKKSEVFEAAADVEPALEEARVAPLPERHQRADDDGDAERRDHDDVDVGAALAERRVGDAFDDDAEQEHEHEREQVTDAE